VKKTGRLLQVFLFREQNGATATRLINRHTDGLRSLNGVQKVVSSNLTAPTIFAKEFKGVAFS